MTRFFSRLAISLLTVSCLFLTSLASPISAAENPGFVQYMAGSLGIGITGCSDDLCGEELSPDTPVNLGSYLAGTTSEEGNLSGLFPTGSKYLALMYQGQPSSREYIADVLDSIGIPQVSRAYAQGTGYQALSPFLSFWKTFRNLAYSLYIIMFVVVGIMIMLRTKVNAQTVITIQSALPNLVITLLLITFSYAIVGFMIDLMYFLIYLVVYLLAAAQIISTPTQTIARLLGYNAWSVVFEGRNSIISGVALALREVLTGIGSLTQGARIVAGVASLGTSEIFMNGFTYLLVAVWIGIAMIKLIFVLIKSYVMLLVQTITAPLQLLMNAMPGSKAFGNWLKTTASYLIPFPVAAAMFIMAAVFVGDPTDATLFGDNWFGDANPFGINANHEFYRNWESNQIWMPPFTLTGTDWSSKDLMVLLGLFIFTMTPATVKMAQEWLQVKESPYAAEAFQGFVGLGQTAIGYPMGLIKQGRAMHEQKRIQEYGASRYAAEMQKIRAQEQGKQASKEALT